ncbi:hypothetical protein P879_00076 [Paragonimus westermani]|uniref:Uncharacterized protein n=1 Tax=Paragonimus westermani TaxID=34504 RepID=A0A8T0DUE2_9TREM|nr:hypothetical protein P879_00076 [Paragonimus westermani]
MLALNSAARRIFLPSGEEIYSLEQINNIHHMFISCGESFKDPRKQLEGDPTVLEQLNGYLKYSTKLELAAVHIRFLTEGVTARQYPKYFWRVLRRNGIQPTESTLKRHALNELETNSARNDKLTRNLSHRVTSIESLTTEERVQFEDYVE